MAEKIFLEVTIDGLPPLKAVRSINITQGIFEHHSFEVVVPSESIEPRSEDFFNKLPDLIGKKIGINWETGTFKKAGEGKDKSFFNGIVMDVSVSGQRKDHMLVSITGKSPTVLMDGVANSEVYENMDLLQLYNAANSFNPTTELKAGDHLSYKEKIPFAVQFNETDFDFMCRMMHENGEWLYYDGKMIRLGFLDAPTLSLKPHRASSLDFSFSASRPMATLAAWDYLADANVPVVAAAPTHSDTLASKVQQKATGLYPEPRKDEVNLAFPSYADGDKHQPTKKIFQDRLDKERQSYANGTFRLVGATDLAEMQLGTILDLEGFAYGGRYIVTHVTHSASDRGNYQNYFQAVPRDAGIPSSVQVRSPRIANCVAKVTDNKDPEKLGRVRVKFEWGNNDTPWLRSVVPHAGNDRGFYFVPEVGDEVMVGFEMGHERFPFVIGALYNGQNAQKNRYHDKDKIKVIRTIGGNEIIFNDNGVLTVQNGKNTIELSCKDDGLLTVRTDGDLELKAENNISIEAGKDLSIEVGGNMKVEAKQKIEVSAGTSHLLTSGTETTVKAKTDLKVQAGTSLALEGTTSTSVKGAKTKVESTAGTEVTSAAITEVKGSLVKIN